MGQNICGRATPTEKKKAPTAETVRAVITGKPLLSVFHDTSIAGVSFNNNDFSEMEGIPGIETNNVSELIEKDQNVGVRERTLLIMNKAVSIERSYRTYLYRGLVFYDCWIFGRALNDLEKALKYEHCRNEQMSAGEVKNL